MNTDIRLSPTLGPSGYKSPPFFTGTKKLIEKEKEEEKTRNATYNCNANIII